MATPARRSDECVNFVDASSETTIDAQMVWPKRWVLLRGLGRESQHWFDFPERFADGAGLDCLTLDLPGTGEQRAAPSPLSIPEIARDVARRFQTTPGARDGETGVLALSLGAMVALSWASEHPVDMAALVLVNSSSSLSSPFERIRPGGLAQLLRSALETDPVARESMIYQLTLNADGPRIIHEATRAAALARSAPIKRRTVARQLLAAARFSPPKVETPTLVLSSAQDSLVNPVCSERLAAYLGCPHLRHPTAGHDLPLEDPDWVIARVGDWSDALSAAQADPAPRAAPRGRQPPDRTSS